MKRIKYLKNNDFLEIYFGKLFNYSIVVKKYVMNYAYFL